MHMYHSAISPAQIETLGQIAPAIAHDINNLLSGILGYSQIIISDPSAGVLKSYAEEIEKACKRISGLIRLLQVFNPSQMFSEELLDMRPLSQELEKYAPHILGKNIQLFFQETAPLHPVRADKTLLRQAFLLWFVLLRKLMPHGGRIVIDMKNKVSAKESRDNIIPEVAIQANLHGAVSIPSFSLHNLGAEIEESLKTDGSVGDLAAVLRLCGGRITYELHDEGVLSVLMFFPSDPASSAE